MRGSAWCVSTFVLQKWMVLMDPASQVIRFGHLMGLWLFQGGPVNEPPANLGSVNEAPANLSSKGLLSHIANTFLGNFIELFLKQFMCTAVMDKLAILTHCERMFLKRETLLVKTNKWGTFHCSWTQCWCRCLNSQFPTRYLNTYILN